MFGLGKLHFQSPEVCNLWWSKEQIYYMRDYFKLIPASIFGDFGVLLANKF